MAIDPHAGDRPSWRAPCVGWRIAFSFPRRPIVCDHGNPIRLKEGGNSTVIAPVLPAPRGSCRRPGRGRRNRCRRERRERALQSRRETVSPRQGAWIETQALGERDLLQKAFEAGADAIVIDLGESAEVRVSRNGGIDPETRTLVLCLHPETEPLGERTIAATACAFFLNGGEEADVEHVVNDVHARTCRDGQRIRSIRSAAVHVPPSLLKPRELQILELLAQEKTSKEIAEVLDMSPRTVDAHRSKLMKKLGVQSTVGLAAYAIRTGLVGA